MASGVVRETANRRFTLTFESPQVAFLYSPSSSSPPNSRVTTSSLQPPSPSPLAALPRTGISTMDRASGGPR